MAVVCIRVFRVRLHARVCMVCDVVDMLVGGVGGWVGVGVPSCVRIFCALMCCVCVFVCVCLSDQISGQVKGEEVCSSWRGSQTLRLGQGKRRCVKR